MQRFVAPAPPIKSMVAYWILKFKCLERRILLIVLNSMQFSISVHCPKLCAAPVSPQKPLSLTILQVPISEARYWRRIKIEFQIFLTPSHQSVILSAFSRC